MVVVVIFFVHPALRADNDLSNCVDGLMEVAVFFVKNTHTRPTRHLSGKIGYMTSKR